jgi:hypothetical protein
MSDRKVTVSFRLKLEPYYDTSGYLESVSAEMYHDGVALDGKDRIVGFNVAVPVSLWDIPQLEGTVKTSLEKMLTDIVEGHEHG